MTKTAKHAPVLSKSISDTAGPVLDVCGDQQALSEC